MDGVILFIVLVVVRIWLANEIGKLAEKHELGFSLWALLAFISPILTLLLVVLFLIAKGLLK